MRFVLIYFIHEIYLAGLSRSDQGISLNQCVHPKLKKHKTFLCCPGLHMNVLCAFNFLHKFYFFQNDPKLRNRMFWNYKFLDFFFFLFFSIFNKNFEKWLSENSGIYVDKCCGSTFFIMIKMPASTFLVASGVQDPDKSQCRAPFIKDVKLGK